MKEIRRRTKVVGAFPDGPICLNLAETIRGPSLVDPKIHEHDAALGGEYLNQRSRRLMKCAKEFEHYTACCVFID